MELNVEEYTAADLIGWQEAERIEAAQGKNPESYRLWMSIAFDRLEDAEYAAASIAFRRALRIAQAVWGENALETAKCTVHAAPRIAAYGKRQEALSLIRIAKPVLEVECGYDDPYPVRCREIEIFLSK